MMYEHDYEEIKLTEEQRNAVQLGVGNIEELNTKIKEVVNRRGKLGWEACYPFSVPYVWFKRPVVAKKPKKS